MTAWRMTQTAVIAALVAGCGGKSSEDSSPSGDTGTSSPEAEACAARSEAGLAMTPGTGANSTAPAIQELNTSYTIELGPSSGGWVRLVLPDAGTYTVHTGFAGVLVGVLDDAGPIEAGPGRPNRVCPAEIPEVFTLTVEGPTTYYLQLGPLSSVYFWVWVQQES